jgi:UDP-N-acetylglucosamine--N-acetylmuramyl-(pentapeptide) pyrophosphoryl-undecaprenol N-acetylglucosamine transferase
VLGRLPLNYQLGCESMNVIFTCGGTGGHISPALAVANLLRERHPDTKILFVGAEDGMETDLVPRAGYDLETVKITNFQRKLDPSGIVHNIKSLAYMVGSRRRADQIIKDFQPHVIVGTGGYASYPMLRQGTARKIPTALHESNAVPGLTTKLVMERVDRVMVSFEESRGSYPDPEKVRVVGMPVRSEFLLTKKAEARRTLGLDDRPLIVSFWGSLGAREMNKMIGGFMAKDYQEHLPFQHIHAAGSYGYKWMPDYVRERGVPLDEVSAIDLREFIYDMPTVMAAADLVICRAGAATISEVAAAGKPAIFVPSPNVTDNHQEKNARILEQHGGAVVLRESECSAEVLYEKAKELLGDRPRLETMGRAVQALAVPDSAERICQIILDLAKN